MENDECKIERRSASRLLHLSCSRRHKHSELDHLSIAVMQKMMEHERVIDYPDAILGGKQNQMIHKSKFGERVVKAKTTHAHKSNIQI